VAVVMFVASVEVVVLVAGVASKVLRKRDYEMLMVVIAIIGLVIAARNSKN